MPDYSKKRTATLVASCIMDLFIGALYTWSVFSGPLAQHIGGLLGRPMTSADMAVVFTVANAICPLPIIFGGLIVDRFGPKPMFVSGAILYGGGLFLTGFAGSVTWVVVTFGLIACTGLGFVYGTTIGHTVKLFPDRRGLVGGLTTACYGIGSVIMPPVGKFLMDTFGTLPAFRIMGLTCCGAICLCSLAVERHRGAGATRLAAAGATQATAIPAPAAPAPATTAPTTPAPATPAPDTPAPATPAPATPATATPAPQNPCTDMPRHGAVQESGAHGERPGLDFKGMLRTGDFYVMFFMLTCGAFAGTMVISQASPMASGLVGMSTMAATLAVSVLALSNTAGRILAGMLSDRFGRIPALYGTYAVSLAGTFLLFASRQGAYVVFMAGIICVGLGFGALMGIFPGFTADVFGAAHNTMNYGFMFIGYALSGVVAPLAMSGLLQATGRYTWAFLVSAALTGVGFLLAKALPLT
ncbi:MAG: MFS transporter [Lachnospiraceae bacterium]|jgi:MFS family permease|nr:MFS transporter [Lachnospiraceae bacterium]